jgi:hypothetical protein
MLGWRRRLKLSRTLAFLLVAALILVPTVTIRAQAQKPLSMPGYPAVGAPAIVTTLAPGAAPRTPIRYKVAANYKDVMEMTMGIGMTMNVGGMAMPVDMPPMTLSATIDVTGVAPNGDITFNLAFTKMGVAPGADPNIAAAMQAAGASITGLKGSATVSSRGVTKSAKLDFSKVDPSMQQALGQMTSSVENLSMPFPEEALGIGGRWEVRQTLSSGGITMFQKAEYEITAMDATSVSVKVKVDQQAPPQPFSNPSMPPGVDATIDKMSGSGTGTMTIRLDALVPTSTIETLSSMVMGMNMGGQVQSMTSDTRMKMSIAPGVRK